jgi:hypothetical protein
MSPIDRGLSGAVFRFSALQRRAATVQQRQQLAQVQRREVQAGADHDRGHQIGPIGGNQRDRESSG